MRILTPAEHHILIDKWTEAPYTGAYVDHHLDGIYTCRQCGSPLYRSDSKFDSHCGWPSFDDAIPGKVLMQSDTDQMRTEILCRHCGGHLWHVFVGEQQTANNTRHCVNSLSMLFVSQKDLSDDIMSQIPDYEVATLGGWCFWCIEGALQQIAGIIEIRSGYMWGKRPFPTYERICTGVSGYIEIVQVFFDPALLSYERLLWYFFAIHDPTSRDKQGNDSGIQYRSVIFTHWDIQSQIAQDSIARLDTSWVYTSPIVTEIRPVERFYLAEAYHQNFYTNNPHKPYCQLVVQPKIKKIQSLLESYQNL